MNWTFPPEPDIPPDLRAWAGDDLLARLLVQRGIATVQAARAFTTPNDYEPAPPAALPDMALAVARLSDAIDRRTPICVWGDFDVDGQTATALLVDALRALGAEARYYVPHRLTEGHGIGGERLEQVLQDGAKLILTCDTGIEAHKAVETIHRAGVAVIITDHHDPGQTLPPAEAVINPKRLPADHPLRELPGVGVAFKLVEGLAGARGQPQLAEPLLDLVALGIVADVAVQTADTRYLLQRGLAALRRTERPGLLALIELSNLNRRTLTAEHIAFWLGPRLNALGRLGDANQGVELLTTADRGRARILAAQLDALNERRKLLVDRTVVQALSQLADTPSLAEYNAIVLAAADWHPGVIGIACSRLAEQFNRPAILLALRDDLARGSARSVPGCDIHRAIKTQARLLRSFGGHPMAAGLALHPHHLNDFRQGLSDALRPCVARYTPGLTVDAAVTLPELNFDLLKTVRKLAPFGAGNPPVTLGVTGVTVQTEALIGRTQAHRRLTIADDGGNTARVIWWNSAGELLPDGPFDLALRISRDTYRGGNAVQLVWVDARHKAPSAPPIERRVFDLRTRTDLQFLLEDPDAVFWTTERRPNVRRFSIDDPAEMRVKKLVIWQAPPGQDVLRQTLAAARPEAVYLVARPTPLDTLPAFMKHLMGLVKFALARYGGRLDVAALAGTMMHREATVRLGLAWLVEQGKLRIIVQTDETLVVRAGGGAPSPGSEALQVALRELLHETAAYRNFVRLARLPALGLD